MDLATLRRLATDGFEVVPATTLENLIPWCDDWAAATGEARFGIIAEALREIDDHWGEQGIPTGLVHAIERCLKENLTPAIDSDDPREGAHFAVLLRGEIRSMPWTAEAWAVQGWV
jgi:hypothetical protein